MSTGQPSNEDTALLYLLMQDLRDQDIADRLFISVRTLHRRLENLMLKAGASTRFGLGAYAVSYAWIEPSGVRASGDEPALSQVA